ncbi:MAG: hypothetical protein HQK79_22025 [Desulfobacterales bacterium]|nr:hypothetical protein [Desulfobacterales bacterium]MBF0398806.1 hypothetical protein [Desulfobacterales bacterium]
MWDSKVYLESGKIEHKLFGNAPLIINKHDGTLIESGTQAPAWFI